MCQADGRTLRISFAHGRSNLTMWTIHTPKIPPPARLPTLLPAPLGTPLGIPLGTPQGTLPKPMMPPKSDTAAAGPESATSSS